MKELHPDRGGDRREFLRLQAHFEQAMAACGGEVDAASRAALDSSASCVCPPRLGGPTLRFAPGWPASTTYDARVIAGAPGLLTISTARKSVRHGFGRDRAADVAALAIVELHARVLGQDRVAVSAAFRSPLPPLEMTVPTNSVATTGVSAWRSSTRRLFTQLEWMSPVSTIGIGDLAVVAGTRTSRHSLVRVAGPLVHGIELRFARLLVDHAHHHLLGQHVPLGGRLGQRRLAATFAAARRAACFWATARLRSDRTSLVAVGLIGAILARVEHQKFGEPAERNLAIQLHVRAVRQRRAAAAASFS